MKRKRSRHNPSVTFGLVDGHILSILECCGGCVHVEEVELEQARALRARLGEMLSEIASREIAGVVRTVAGRIDVN